MKLPALRTVIWITACLVIHCNSCITELKAPGDNVNTTSDLARCSVGMRLKSTNVNAPLKMSCCICLSDKGLFTIVQLCGICGR